MEGTCHSKKENVNGSFHTFFVCDAYDDICVSYTEGERVSPGTREPTEGEGQLAPPPIMEQGGRPIPKHIFFHAGTGDIGDGLP